MIPDTTYRDLLTICGDGFAPPANVAPAFPKCWQWRATAHRLLRDELAARLRDSDRDWELNAGHPAFVPDDALEGGVETARLFWGHQDGALGVSVPRVPNGGYAAALAPILPAATALIADVRAAVGDAPFDAIRFHVRRSVAAAGAPVPLQPLFVQATGNDAILAAGIHRVQFAGLVYDFDPAVSTLSFGIALDGTVVATHSSTRNLSGLPADEQRRLACFPAPFVTDDSITVSSPSQTFTLVNTSTGEELVDGLLRVWVA